MELRNLVIYAIARMLTDLSFGAVKQMAKEVERNLNDRDYCLDQLSQRIFSLYSQMDVGRADLKAKCIVVAIEWEIKMRQEAL